MPIDKRNILYKILLVAYCIHCKIITHENNDINTQSHFD